MSVRTLPDAGTKPATIQKTIFDAGVKPPVLRTIRVAGMNKSREISCNFDPDEFIAGLTKSPPTSPISTENLGGAA